MEPEIKIDASLIPAIELRLLASTLLPAIKKHMEDPENQKRFKAWQQDRLRQKSKN